jgi:hypothetical protein
MGTTSTSTSTTTTSAPVTTTTASSLGTSCPSVTAAASGAQGAAGTQIGTITLTNPGPSSCTIFGYPTLYRYDAGNSIPVTIVHGLTVNLGPPATSPPSTVILAAGQQAEFTYQYSDVPTGGETTCATSSSMAISVPGVASPSGQFPLTMAPCNNNTVDVSPVYSAASSTTTTG